MDESGITMQVLSTSSPAVQGITDVATAVETAKRTNDAMAEVIRSRPGRLTGLGEALPFLLGRLDEGYAMAFKSRQLKKPFSEYTKENILVTTSGKYKPEALICTIAAMGTDRVLFAADYPWVTPKEAVEHLERTPMSDADREKIYHLNAERVFRL